MLIDCRLLRWLKCDELSRNNLSLYPAVCWGETCTWQLIELSICSLKVSILSTSEEQTGAELFTLLSEDVVLLVSSFIIAQQAPVFIHCIINTAKWICNFIFFECESDSQPHNDVHNSHAVLVVIYIGELWLSPIMPVCKRFLYLIAPVPAGDNAFLDRT